MSAPVAQDRTDKFAKRLDAHLRQLESDTERRDFLTHQRERWLELSDAFVRDIAANRPTANGVTIYDFEFTIMEISSRLSRLEEPAYA